MKVRILLEPEHGGSYQRILALARATEAAGFEAFFRSDHYRGVDAEDTSFEPTDSWTTLAGLARDTSRVRLGTLVSAGTFREPGVLAISVATVDQMSGGRVELGLGSGWYEREHAAFGLRFPALAERFDRLEEQLAVVDGIWNATPAAPFDFQGKHYSVHGCDTPPGIVQPGGPPLIIGGAGPRRTPALAARFAAEYNGTFPDGLAERYAVVDRACEQIGRDPATLRRSVILPVACGEDAAAVQRRTQSIRTPMLRDSAVCGTAQNVLDRAGELHGAGADTLYFHLYDVDDLEHVALLGRDVLPDLARL